MKIINKVLFASAALVSAQAQAGVDVTGFSIGGGSVPTGIIAMVLLLAGAGFVKLRRTR